MTCIRGIIVRPYKIQGGDAAHIEDIHISIRYSALTRRHNLVSPGRLQSILASNQIRRIFLMLERHRGCFVAHLSAEQVQVTRLPQIRSQITNCIWVQPSIAPRLLIFRPPRRRRQQDVHIY